MPTTKTSRGRSQDRSKVAGGQEYEVSYESKKTGKSSAAIKSAVQRAGNSRAKLESGMKSKKSK